MRNSNLILSLTYKYIYIYIYIGMYSIVDISLTLISLGLFVYGVAKNSEWIGYSIGIYILYPIPLELIS